MTISSTIWLTIEVGGTSPLLVTVIWVGTSVLGTGMPWAYQSPRLVGPARSTGATDWPAAVSFGGLAWPGLREARAITSTWEAPSVRP